MSALAGASNTGRFHAAYAHLTAERRQTAADYLLGWALATMTPTDADEAIAAAIRFAETGE
jgi:hypothetical protein